MISLLGLQLDSELSRSFRGASGETFLRMGKKQPSKFMAATSLNHDGLNQMMSVRVPTSLLVSDPVVLMTICSSDVELHRPKQLPRMGYACFVGSLRDNYQDPAAILRRAYLAHRTRDGRCDCCRPVMISASLMARH